MASDDKPDDPVSLEERRRKNAHDKIMEGMETTQTLVAKMFDDRKKRMDYLGEWFGLEEPYNYKVLSMLLLACEEGRNRLSSHSQTLAGSGVATVWRIT